MYRKILFIGLFFSLFLFGACSNEKPSDDSLVGKKNSGKIEVAQGLQYNWGDINMYGGNVEHTFEMKNAGKDDLVLKGAITSCGCTTVKFEFTDGSFSSKFGMRKNPIDWAVAVKSGEEFKVHVSFDPLFHGPKAATGSFKRTVWLTTSSKSYGKIAVVDRRNNNGTVTELLLSGNVLSEEEYQKKGAEVSEYSSQREDHHDEDEYLAMPEYEIRGRDVLQKIEAKEKFVLIDVREDAELKETGVIETMIHVPLGSLSLDAMNIRGISKTDEVVVYCRSGNRSRRAYDLLTALGFSNVKSMRGGMIHWLEDKRPVVEWKKEAVDTKKSSDVGQIQEEGAVIVFDRESEDLGLIGSKEIKVTTFTVSNKGAKVLTIGNISTSCACTSAEIGSKSIEPGMSTILTVTFDPMVHAEPEDKFKRTVFLETNDPSKPEAEVSIYVDIDEDKS